MTHKSTITPATSPLFCNHLTEQNAHRWVLILSMHFECVTFQSLLKTI